ncbi:hypothetical protein LUZ60_013861 [Juncus effusus]|nr:hypothetical protein LUZ60_013861 [Juncus effusus]
MSGTCPEGTVPIRRTSQTNNISGFSFPFAQLVQMNVAGSQQTEAVVDYSTRGPYLGATATVTIWDPHVEPNEYSNTFIMVGGVEPNKMRHGTNVPFINLNYQIAFGWIVSPAYYHDSLPRLHLYLTLNGGDTNCMNYECNLFVHTNNTITLGGSVSPISTMGGPTSHIDIEIHRDLDDIKWWVSYNHVAIGYFPSEAVDRFYYGSLNMRGAIVLNTKPRGKHTSTQMGSGRFPIEGIVSPPI